jgi:hypothetical protein
MQGLRRGDGFRGETGGFRESLSHFTLHTSRPILGTAVFFSYRYGIQNAMCAMVGQEILKSYFLVALECRKAMLTGFRILETAIGQRLSTSQSK